MGISTVRLVLQELEKLNIISTNAVLCVGILILSMSRSSMALLLVQFDVKSTVRDYTVSNGVERRAT